MKVKTKADQVWSAWDIELNKFGVWIIIGSIGCLTLTPIPGIISLAMLVWLGMELTDSKQIKRFIDFKALEEKDLNDKTSKQEREYIDKFKGDTLRFKKHRKTKIYWMSIFFLAASFLYLSLKTFVLQLSLLEMFYG
jgi:hypothetical protein